MKLVAVISPTNRALSARAVAGLDDDLDRLRTLVHGSPVPVHLVGGLAMAVRAGRYYRNHRDADIAVFVEDLPAFGEHLGSRGYHLGLQRAYSHGSPRFRLQLARRLDRCDLRSIDPDRSKVRAFPAAPRRIRPTVRRTDYIDVFLLGRSVDGVVLHGYGATVPWDSWYPLTLVDAGGTLRLPNAQYRRFLPPRGGKQRQDFDVAGMRPVAHRPLAGASSS